MSEFNDNADALISFDEVFDISQVANYHEQFNKLLNDHKKIVFNAENIERIDGAGLQLLTAFFKQAESLEISVQWQNCSEVLKNSAKLSGLTGSLRLE